MAIIKGLAATIARTDSAEEERAAKRAFLDRLKENDEFMELIEIKKQLTPMGADYIAIYECTLNVAKKTKEEGKQ